MGGRRKIGAESRPEHMAERGKGLKTLPYLMGRASAMLRVLHSLVEIESFSAEKSAVDRCGLLVAAEFRRRGGRVRILRNAARGNLVRVEIGAGRALENGQLLVIGHLDSVYPLGTLRRMPFRVARGRAWGPGTFDMKGGVVLALFAVEALRTVGISPRRKIVFLWTGDEEIGSESSRAVIEKEARRSDAVLGLEPALGIEGRAKTRRKGIGEIEI